MSTSRAILGILLSTFLTPAGAVEPADGVRLIFAGDILLSRQVERELDRAKGSPWQALSPLFHGADFVMGNFEGAVGEHDACPVELAERHLCFAVREEFLPLLHGAGFSAVGIENNHSGDLGPVGKQRTTEALNRAGVGALNFTDSPYFYRRKGITISIVAVDLTSAKSSLVELRQKFRLATNFSDLVVAYVHWGSELKDWVSDDQELMANWLVENGADLVVGHHPHVIERASCVSGKPVFYSLGNNLFDQKYPATKEGALADCVISNGEMRCGALRSKIGESSFFPLAAERDKALSDNLSSCTVRLHATLAIDGFSMRPVIDGEWATSVNIAIEGLKDGMRAWRTPAKRLLALEKLQVEGGRDLLFTLEEHYSPLDKEHSPRPYVYDVGAEMLAAKWRGSALAWPLIDAVLVKKQSGMLCALHRGDSFLVPEPETRRVRTAVYQWNGFGFSGVQDHAATESCRNYYKKEAESLTFVD